MTAFFAHRYNKGVQNCLAALSVPKGELQQAGGFVPMLHRNRHVTLLAVGLLTLLFGAQAHGQEPATEDGMFVSVNHPITSEVFSRVRETVERARHRNDRKIRKIVFDFNPSGAESATRDFGPCYDLAEYILSLHEFSTIAFVHNKVTRHSVLPVLSCRELVMAGTPETRIGEVLPEHQGPIPDLYMQFYTKVAGPQKNGIVVKMLDKDAEVLEGRLGGARYFFDRRKTNDALRAGVAGIKPEPVMKAGTLALLHAAEARDYGLCQLANRDTRQQVAEAYGLSAASLNEDPLQGRTPSAWRIVVNGQINSALRESIRRQVQRAIGKGANLVFVQLEQGLNGDSVIAAEIAKFFQELRDDRGLARVMTVAYVPYQANEMATFLALGCNEIVMGKDAVIGDFSGHLKYLKDRGEDLSSLKPLSASLADFAVAQGISPNITQGMLDPELVLIRARTRIGSPERRIMTESELTNDRQSRDPKWQDDGQIKGKGTTLKLTASLAKDLGIVRHVTQNPADPRELYAAYGLLPEQVRETTPDLFDAFAEFLRIPIVAVALVAIGICCLILEIKIPGVTAPGVISALCFVLFFWSQSVFSGQFIVLAILLFLLGLVLVGIEVFVLPGFGFVGFSGIVLMLGGLGLATVERLPQTSSEWMRLGSTMTQFGVGMLAATAGALFLARYLHKIPLANRLVLIPPTGPQGDEEEPPLPGAEQAAALLGAVGTAATMLRPAGMARFGEAYIDVVSEGSYVPAGARIQVIEVEGNRVVVKEI